ncbi:hypothetical protein SEUCBS140593_002382 [Sporothrix eucalyptigena]|uniref:Uncharacterized protein n=1 Tax=Sporothrix eucalyptigena TaxID=1812306 RepID=A0ABP0B645_9PEZI
MDFIDRNRVSEIWHRKLAEWLTQTRQQQAFVSIATDIGSILLYNAKSIFLAVTIVGDLFAIAFCAVGATNAALSRFNGGEGSDPHDPHPPNEILRSNPGGIIAIELSQALV